MFNSADFLRQISEGLSWIVTTCEFQGLLRLFDNHTIAERFFCRLLNSAYQLQLQHMEQVQANHPAFDLGDPNKRVAYQITSDKNSEKVQHTLDKFVEKGFERQYDTLRILIIGKRQKTYSSVDVPAQLNFDCTRDIVGIPELLEDINKLDTTRLGELSKIMAEELKPREQVAWSKKRVALGTALAALAVGAMVPIWIAAPAVEPPKARLPLG